MQALILAAALTATFQQAMLTHHHAEEGRVPWYVDLATGSPSVTDVRLVAPWPFALQSIGHSNASYQNYGGAPYFHHGIDVRGDAGTDVLSPVTGKVVNIENYVAGDPAYWEIAIQDGDGYIWQFHHIDHDSIPQAIHDAFAQRSEIPVGTLIGKIFYWSVTTMGERFHHIHINVLATGGVYINSFRFLAPLPDTQGPEMVAVVLVKNGQRVSGNSVSGDYQVYIEAKDLILHTKFIVPPYRVAYSVDGGAEHVVWQFDQLPGGSSAERYVSDFFIPSLTCGDYSCRKFGINLGFSQQGTVNFPAQAGPHTITVSVADFAGNRQSKQYQWEVR